MTTKEPAFEEGPFFLIESALLPHIGGRAVIWATDETTARNTAFHNLNLPLAYCAVSHLGDLDATKKTLRLSPAQIADLHREGYLRL